MPQVKPAILTQLATAKAQAQSIAAILNDGHEEPPKPDPLELVYNIRTCLFRTARRSSLLKQNLKTSPLLELRANNPPLLVDGRMQIIEIPKWKWRVEFWWRSSDGQFTTVKTRVVSLPGWVWIERNFGEEKRRWRDLWIERC